MWTLNDDPVTTAAFWAELSAAQYKRVDHRVWATDVGRNAVDLDGCEILFTDQTVTFAIVAGEESLALLRIDDGRVHVWVGAEDEAALAAARARFAEMFPPATSTAELLPVTFWSYSSHGPRQVTRKIAVQPWEQIAANYGAGTRAQLDAMVDGFKPSHGGQLILWQGEPGTGKTHALRAIASEWRGWADLHYIVDPDELFGGHADYLIDVLLCDTYRDENEPSDQAERWRVLVLEDTGELLAADAKERTGQALSRLLNTVDGMIGQGLKILVLVTTNEELKKLHPAVSRPGRCAARLTFEELDRETVTAWAAEHEVELEDDSPRTLAELYAAAEHFEQTTSRRRVGFASV